MRHRVHIQQWRSRTAWALIFSILLQPVIAYLATPSIAQDQRGHYVLLCTLKGLQEVYIEGGQAPAASGDEEYCPALKLYNLISHAKTVTAFQIPDPRAYAVASLDARFDRPASLHESSVYPIRAPPIC